jgi:hypothetical protein
MAINETVKKIADVVAEKHLSFDAETRTLKTTGNAMESALAVINEEEKLGLDEKQIKNTFQALSLFTAGTGLATGEAGIKEMKKDKSIDALTAEFGVTKQVKVKHTVSRDYEVTPIPRNGEKVEPVTKHGRLDTKLEVSGVKARSSANLAAVRDHLYAQGEEKLGK